jgi:hypothetical protein
LSFGHALPRVHRSACVAESPRVAPQPDLIARPAVADRARSPVRGRRHEPKPVASSWCDRVERSVAKPAACHPRLPLPVPVGTVLTVSGSRGPERLDRGTARSFSAPAPTDPPRGSGTGSPWLPTSRRSCWRGRCLLLSGGQRNPSVRKSWNSVSCCAAATFATLLGLVSTLWTNCRTAVDGVWMLGPEALVSARKGVCTTTSRLSSAVDTTVSCGCPEIVARRPFPAG